MTLVRLTAYLCTYLAYSTPVFAQCAHVNYSWTGAFGQTAPRAISTDPLGDIFLTGYFGGMQDFDPSAAIDQHASNGIVDGFVTKLRSDGSYAWTYAVGGIGHDEAAAAITASDYVFLVGNFAGTVDFDPGPVVDEYTAPPGVSNPFITMLHADGSYVATRRLDWPRVGVRGAVSVPGAWQIALVGGYYGPVDFNPGPAEDVHFGLGVFVSTLGLDGSYGWTRTFGSTGFEGGTGIAADPAGNVVITGTFRGAVDFDPGPAFDVHRQVGGIEDIFVTKFYSDGSYAWTRTSPADFDSDIGQVAVDEAGNAYFSGCFSTTIDFDPTDGVDVRVPTPTVPPSISPHDIFVTQLHADGSYGWTYTAGGDGIDLGKAVATTADSVFVVGWFYHTMDFDPGPGVDEHTAAGGNADGFLLELARNGSFRWAKTWGGSGPDGVADLAVDGEGNLIIWGGLAALVDGPTDADPTCSVDDVWLAAGQSVAFVTKFLCADPGDFDLDGDVDLADMARFQTCFTGPDAPRCSPGCDAFDIASNDPASSGVDNAIDLADFDALAPLLTGPQ